MTGSTLKPEWPSPEVDTVDREIEKRVHLISANKASASDVSEATFLIRKRAGLMMPGVFERLRREGVLKKSS